MRFWLVLVVLCCGQPGMTRAEDEPVIAVASNFYPVMEEISQHYTALTGEHVRLTSGASGTLTHQIKLGAPIELFLSADESFVKQLYARGLTRDEGRIYATGRLVLFINHAVDIPEKTDAESVLEHFNSTGFLQIALPNPALAPYGRAAKEVLERFRLWNDSSTHQLILGENVGQTAQFVLTGDVDLAFLPMSLTTNGRIGETGRLFPVPDDWHSPINQYMVLMKHAGETVTGLYEYLSGAAARQIMEYHGYRVPEMAR